MFFDMDSRFWVDCSWFWVLGSGLFVLGSGFWVVCSWFWVHCPLKELKEEGVMILALLINLMGKRGRGGSLVLGYGFLVLGCLFLVLGSGLFVLGSGFSVLVDCCWLND